MKDSTTSKVTESLIWVYYGPDGPETRLPLYSWKRTQLGHRWRSGSCPMKRLMHRSNSAVYSITSSAVASNAGGMLRPSALAVFKLITSWNFVGC